jgi:hypothetical protein
MYSRATSFPPAAERAFGSHKGRDTFPTGARSAFSKSDDRISHAFGKKSTAPFFEPVPLRPVQLTADMFPALSTAQETPKPVTTTKLSFAELMRKRALEDDAEKARADAVAEAREEERRRTERDRAHLSAISNIRTAYQKGRVCEEEEEFYDEGEAYIRPEDAEPVEHEGYEDAY